MKKGILTFALMSLVTVPLVASCGPADNSSNIDPTTNKPSETETSAPATSEQPKDEPFKVVDVKGREVSFEKHAETALCLGAGALRLYSYVGDMNKLAAVEEYDKPADGKLLRPYQFVFKDVLSKLPTCGLGGPGKPNYDLETLITIKPDVIFTCDKAEAAEIDSISTKTNIPVISIDYGKTNVFSLETTGNPFKTSLKSIATIMGTEDRYNELMTYTDATINDLDTRTKDIADADRQPVYFGGVGKKMAKGLHCSSQNHPILNSVHAKNILDGLTVSIDKNMQVDKEFLTSINPTYVFVDAGGYSDVMTQLSTEGQKETFTNWTAIDNGNTHVVLPYGDYNTQVEFGLINAMFIGKTIYSEKFNDVNINAAAGEVFAKFYGADMFAEYMSATKLNTTVFTTISRP